jgi:hypothetical protein
MRMKVAHSLIVALALLGGVIFATASYAAPGGNGTGHGNGEHNGATHSNCGHTGKSC